MKGLGPKSLFPFTLTMNFGLEKRPFEGKDRENLDFTNQMNNKEMKGALKAGNRVNRIILFFPKDRFD